MGRAILVTTLVLLANSFTPAISADMPLTKNALVDERGFINVWELRKAVSKAAAVPTGDYECNGYEGDGEEDVTHFSSRKERLAYERQREIQETQNQLDVAKCEKTRKQAEQKYIKTRAILNRTWIPILVSAAKLGDPVAEVVLRLCETAPMLDRASIASDCSGDPQDQSYAQLHKNQG